MAGIPYSKSLNYLIAHAKSFAEGAAVLTAARYVLSALEGFLALTDCELKESEKTDLGALFAQYLPQQKNDGFKAAHAFLSHIVETDEENTTGDSLYMQAKLSMAQEAARKNAAAELAPQAVLALIFEDPDQRILECMVGAQPEAPDEKAVEKDIESFAARFAARVERLFQEEDAQNDQTEQTQQDNAVRDPRKSAVAELTEKVKKTHDSLTSIVLGQENAISVFTTGYFQAELSAITDKAAVRPRATFLFAGPPGVGKTFLAEQAAQLLQLPFRRFDMSEYADKEAALEFCGSDSVYKGSKRGNLTEFVGKHPRCVLLFDEIEKAHVTIIHLFLQLLDAGRLRDSYDDSEISFSETILIFTTNAGRQLYENAETRDFSGVTRKVVLKALQNDIDPATGRPFFPEALCSRFASGNVVMFNYITADHLRRIAKKEVLRHAENFAHEVGIEVRVDEQIFTALLFAEGGSVDARMIRGRAKTFFDDELFELFRLLDDKSIRTTIEDLESISICAELPADNDALSALFMRTRAPEILLVSSDEIAKQCAEQCKDAAFLCVQTCEAAKKLLSEHEISFALIDPSFGWAEDCRYLNMEDVDSTARDLFWYLRENDRELPIYLLEHGEHSLNAEEIISFRRQGVRGILCLSGGTSFADTVREVAETLHQQKSMDELASANKLITFETAQSISEDGKHAEIRLFDFEMTVAVEAEDRKNILSNVSKPDIRFDSVIGAEDAKKELKRFISCLKNPKKYLGLGIGAPKGILLYGPPGTGKTMLAKALACESDVTFIAAEGNQFLKKFVGEGPEAVHALFRTARKYAPSVLFIDEIDAIAKERSGDERAAIEATLTAFLTEMDGFKSDPTRPVFVLAATNYDVTPGSRKSLDQAFMRRFDRRIYVPLPDRDARIRYLRMRFRENAAFDLSEEKIGNIAVRATGMSLADLASVTDLSLRTAVWDGDGKVTDDIFEEAFETFTGGESKQWDGAQLERIARHEAGHAFLCRYGGETPSYVTIVARGDHGGYMLHGDGEEKAIFTRRELLAKLRTALGGRAAELVYYGEEDGISTGAGSDLQAATNIAESLLCTYGMDDTFGLSYIDRQAAQSGQVSVMVRDAVNKLLAEQMRSAVELISANRALIDALVERLLEKNHLSGNEIECIFQMNA